MATGDTHPGKVRVVREDTEGNRTIVAGPFAQSDVDYFNNSVDQVEKLYLNTAMSARVSKPANARSKQAPDTEFQSGEKLIIQHQANTTTTNDIDVSADSFNISILREDKNRGRIYPDTLTQADQELSTDPAEDTANYVGIYQETVPDRTEIRIAGSFEAVAVEN